MPIMRDTVRRKENQRPVLRSVQCSSLEFAGSASGESREGESSRVVSACVSACVCVYTCVCACVRVFCACVRACVRTSERANVRDLLRTDALGQHDTRPSRRA